jgi:hypothetical protein
MLTYNQKYGIATALATTDSSVVRNRLKDSPDGLEFLAKIEKYFIKKDGFIPKKVIQIINSLS